MTTLEYDEIMQRAPDEAVHTLGADFGTIAVLEGGDWVSRYENGTTRPTIGRHRPYKAFRPGRLAVETERLLATAASLYGRPTQDAAAALRDAAEAFASRLRDDLHIVAVRLV